MHQHTPCSSGADVRARRFVTHRTPCTDGADDRAHRLMPHRTPCTYRADDREDKRCTPCTTSGTSPRARTAPLCEGLSSASCPCSPLHHHSPRPSPRARAQPRPRFRRGYARGRGATTSSSRPRESARPEVSRCCQTREQITRGRDERMKIVNSARHQTHHGATGVHGDRRVDIARRRTDPRAGR